MKNKEKQIEEMSDLLEHIIFQYYPHLIPEEELKKHAEYALKYYQPKLPKDSIVLSGLELADYKHYKEYTKTDYDKAYNLINNRKFIGWNTSQQTHQQVFSHKSV